MVAHLPLPALAGLLSFAALLRWAAYSGYFGSDEVTYTGAAFALLDGDWSVSGYVGANRFGVNLPVAAFAWLFGRNEFGAAAYSVVCSLAEVALVTWFGARMFGARAGLLAGLVLATLPIHVHYAGRLMADAPFALAVTASFLFFWDGEVRKRPLSYLLAGLAAGWSFWIKPAAIFYIVVFLTYPLLFRRLDLRWGWMIGGFLVAMVANGLFFWVLKGQFWFVLQNMAERRASGYLDAELSAGSLRNEAGFYLVYLFGKVYHTWLLGFLGLAAVALWLYRRRRGGSIDTSMPFVVWWGVGLLLILSVLFVSVSPLTLVPKQTNYMLIFTAPLALLAGYALVSCRDGRQIALVAITVLPAIVLGFMLQTRIMVFTANSKAALRHALDHPGATVYANTNGFRLGLFHGLVNAKTQEARIRSIDHWNRPDAGVSPGGGERIAVVDTETISWGAQEPFRKLEDRPACWVPQGALAPVIDGLGPQLVQAMGRGATVLPGGGLIAERLFQLARPKPSYIFRIPEAGC